MKWGNCVISKKEVKDGVVHLEGTIDPEDKDFKKTKKITWITNDPNSVFEFTMVELDHIITKKKVEDNESVKDIVNLNSRVAYPAIAEGSMRQLQHGQIIQLERRGYFRVDKLALGNEKMTLNFVPDGKQSNMSKIKSKLDQKEVAGGKVTLAQKDKAAADAAKKASEDTGDKKLSKKELNKLKKKEGKAAAKSGNPKPAGPPKAKSPAGSSANLDQFETILSKSKFINGDNLS